MELKIPRILKCGHFYLSPEEEADIAADSENDEPEDADDLDICLDCGRRIRDGKYGSVGIGSKRWDIKLFAANGLMRAGAWSAAWREMERVDVEILPWMEEDMKRELELRKEEDEKARAETKEDGVGGLDDERLREIYGGEAQAFVDGRIDETAATAEMAARARREEGDGREEVPLWDLFCNYVHHAAQDRRNIAIIILSFLVLVLSMASLGGSRSSGAVGMSPPNSQDRHSVSTTAIQATTGTPTGSSIQSLPVSNASPAPAASSIESIPDSAASPMSVVPSSTAQPQQSPDEGSESAPWTETSEDEVSELLED